MYHKTTTTKKVETFKIHRRKYLCSVTSICYEVDLATDCCCGRRGKCKILPLVLQTGHHKGEQVEREEDAQAEQHAHHIHLRCGV